MIKMEILESRDAWKENRRKGIGGSEAAAIVGMNPYMTNQELWQIKRGLLEPEDISDKPYVKYGTEAETHLRELFKLDYPHLQVDYVDNNSWTNDKYPWALASLDGWLTDHEGRKGILEIKTTEILQSSQKEKWHDQIPDNYYCQLLHYMAVTEADFAILKAQLKYEFNDAVYLQTKHYPIRRDEVEDDIDYLMQKEKEFWQRVKAGKKPPLILPEL